MIVWSVGRRKLIDQLEALYRSRYRQFLRVAVAIVGDEDVAQDAVQEGFARAIKSARSYRGEGTVEAWLWSVIVNAARAGRLNREIELATPDQPALPSQNGRTDDVDSQVRAWIAALPERQRLAIFLRYYADLDYSAVATALGIEVGTVSATLSTAHAALRHSFKEVPR
jgi:RNA polymerase sigma factor (sigma-70 family)